MNNEGHQETQEYMEYYEHNMEHMVYIYNIDICIYIYMYTYIYMHIWDMLGFNIMEHISYTYIYRVI